MRRPHAARPLERASGSLRRVPARAVALLVLAVTAVVVLLPLCLPGSSPAAPGGRALVGLGAPVAWLVQDQSALDPPVGGAARLVSPWEHPSRVLWGPLLLDASLAVLAVLAVLLVVRRLGGRRSQRAGGVR